MLLAAPFTDDGAQGLFQADAVGLLATVALWAFLARLDRHTLAVLVVSSVPAALVHLALGGSVASLGVMALLCVGVGAAAGGLALLGRRLGAPAATASVLATAVLVTAMLGLFWADPVGDRLPRAKQFAFKQAVLHLDPATAAAYGAASFDRFHEPRIYSDVKLAAEAVRPPDAVPTALAWLLLGLAAGAAAGVLRAPARDEVA